MLRGGTLCLTESQNPQWVLLLCALLTTQQASACSRFWPVCRKPPSNLIFLCPSCNESVMAAQGGDGCVVSNTICCARLLLHQCFLSAAANNMTDSKSGRSLGLNCLIQSPQLSDTGANLQSSLALQANNLHFANHKSIINTDVSVISSQT